MSSSAEPSAQLNVHSIAVDDLAELEKGLSVSMAMYGSHSDAAQAALQRVVQCCNSLAIKFLAADDTKACSTLLKRAMKWTETEAGVGNSSLKVLTQNNIACYHRRRGNLKSAYASLERAMKLTAGCDPEYVAQTYLNACAVMSQLGKHLSALKHAANSVEYSERHLLSVTKSNPPGSVMVSDAYSALALACYNYGVEFEYNSLTTDAVRLYARALGLIQSHVPARVDLSSLFSSCLDAATGRRLRTPANIAKMQSPSHRPPTAWSDSSTQDESVLRSDDATIIEEEKGVSIDDGPGSKGSGVDIVMATLDSSPTSARGAARFTVNTGAVISHGHGGLVRAAVPSGSPTEGDSLYPDGVAHSVPSYVSSLDASPEAQGKDDGVLSDWRQEGQQTGTGGDSDDRTKQSTQALSAASTQRSLDYEAIIQPYRDGMGEGKQRPQSAPLRNADGTLFLRREQPVVPKSRHALPSELRDMMQHDDLGGYRALPLTPVSASGARQAAPNTSHATQAWYRDRLVHVYGQKPVMPPHRRDTSPPSRAKPQQHPHPHRQQQQQPVPVSRRTVQARPQSAVVRGSSAHKHRDGNHRSGARVPIEKQLEDALRRTGVSKGVFPLASDGSGSIVIFSDGAVGSHTAPAVPASIASVTESQSKQDSGSAYLSPIHSGLQPYGAPPAVDKQNPSARPTSATSLSRRMGYNNRQQLPAIDTRPHARKAMPLLPVSVIDDLLQDPAGPPSPVKQDNHNHVSNSSNSAAVASGRARESRQRLHISTSDDTLRSHKHGTSPSPSRACCRAVEESPKRIAPSRQPSPSPSRSVSPNGSIITTFDPAFPAEKHMRPLSAGACKRPCCAIPSASPQDAASPSRTTSPKGSATATFDADRLMRPLSAGSCRRSCCALPSPAQSPLQSHRSLGSTFRSPMHSRVPSRIPSAILDDGSKETEDNDDGDGGGADDRNATRQDSKRLPVQQRKAHTAVHTATLLEPLQKQLSSAASPVNRSVAALQVRQHPGSTPGGLESYSDSFVTDSPAATTSVNHDVTVVPLVIPPPTHGTPERAVASDSGRGTPVPKLNLAPAHDAVWLRSLGIHNDDVVTALVNGAAQRNTSVQAYLRTSSPQGDMKAFAASVSALLGRGWQCDDALIAQLHAGIAPDAK